MSSVKRPARRRDEFPPPPSADFDRRLLLKAMAASLALGGLAGCEPDERALPYVNAPEFDAPDQIKWYATSVVMAGYAQPVFGKTHAGRPTKLEGNDQHPASRGRTDAFTQAALLELYGADRSQAPRVDGAPATWADVETALYQRARHHDQTGGSGLRILTGTVTSSTLARQLDQIAARWPKSRWHVFEPINDDRRRAGMALAFGQPLDRHLLLENAEAIVSLDDDDLLGPGVRQTRHGIGWSARRAAFRDRNGDCALFVAEPAPTLTGIAAEDRLIAHPARIAPLLRALCSRLGVSVPTIALRDDEQAWVGRAAAALTAHRGRGLLTIGRAYAPEYHALTAAVNQRLGNLGQTSRLTAPLPRQAPDGERSFAALCADMAAGRVDTLVIIDCAPGYAAPASANFPALCEKVAFRLHAGLFYDETARLCQWHLPLAHCLESWSDARSVDGMACIVQPLIRPFLAVRSQHVVLENLLGQQNSDAHDLVRATWRAAWGNDFDARWRDALWRGFVPDSAPQPVAPPVARTDFALPPDRPEAPVLLVRPDPTIWDGRFANNPWLQELPKPISKLTWTNVVAISPQQAKRDGLRTGDVIILTLGQRSLLGVAWVELGQQASTVVLTAGYGRRLPGQLGNELGYAAAQVAALDDNGQDTPTLRRTRDRVTLPTTQSHGQIEPGEFVKVVASPDPPALSSEGALPKPPEPSFYPAQRGADPAWGMSVDLDSCIGCNACVVACFAENNISMVGPEEVQKSRFMHWLRIDRYYEGPPETPSMHFQPLPCMHCEQAPCEMGCPVNATVHSPGGVNLQIYNRCIGTRTCSSFCPYKVRHFNWFDYTANDPPGLQAARNPNVTVRSRGVMEKCTYCIQRIAEARIHAQLEGRAIRDGEVRTACQQACPTQAISFGDIADAASEVSRWKALPRDYTLLEDVNTRPRTTYLAKIRPPKAGEA